MKVSVEVTVFMLTRLTNQIFIEKASNLFNNEYIYLEKYKNSHTKIKMQHKNCLFVFSKSPNAHLSKKQGCPKCGAKKRSGRPRKTHEKFLTDARLVHHDQYEYIDQYIHDKTKMTIKHLECGHVFQQMPTKHLQGNGCPHCSSSKGEQIIKKMLEEKKH